MKWMAWAYFGIDVANHDENEEDEGEGIGGGRKKTQRCWGGGAIVWVHWVGIILGVGM
jgi:hypothetical protein